ncbi:Putative substrate binding domain of ABC phosphate transporter [Halomicronema hongdechloris C2206]|uniref:Phosphate-binding protein n=1 Tax=Halomicronema hongdechloris C2206 TaxID=1641165 RepID=A0A1Z3HKM3_9CYAN|nr:PstS family phosphate ABC transporter substrate-binding protein [Halomicronema hongdechloris]ASC70859.1 Putative substrate binding domain of ABC phosphate transporter [Halomicronema hongdechloris C2206]
MIKARFTGAFTALTLLSMGCSQAPTPDSGAEAANGAAITIDGSSTVYPITNEIAQEFQFEHSAAPPITVSFSGTGGGFRKFCAGETDISNASRPITPDEMETCKAAGIEFIELPVAYDALTVVVHRDNDWANDITLEELQTLWQSEAEGTISTWKQIRETWPDQPINLYGPGEDSGTYDYFTEVATGESGESRQDYTASEDDMELVRGVRTDPNALGYFGYAYYEESRAALKALAIDGGEGPVLPSDDTVRDGTYQPFARPLFIYVNAAAAEANPHLQAFVEYYLANARHLVQVVGYVPLPDQAYALALDHFQGRQIGTVFDGQAQPGLTIEALLQKEAAF